MNLLIVSGSQSSLAGRRDLSALTVIEIFSSDDDAPNRMAPPNSTQKTRDSNSVQRKPTVSTMGPSEIVYVSSSDEERPKKGPTLVQNTPATPKSKHKPAKYQSSGSLPCDLNLVARDSMNPEDDCIRLRTPVSRGDREAPVSPARSELGTQINGLDIGHFPDDDISDPLDLLADTTEVSYHVPRNAVESSLNASSTPAALDHSPQFSVDPTADHGIDGAFDLPNATTPPSKPTKSYTHGSRLHGIWSLGRSCNVKPEFSWQGQ